MTRHQIRRELRAVAREIRAHHATAPDDFDGREQLWMRHEDLRAHLA